MEIVIKVPDDCAGKAREVILKFRKSPEEATMAIGTPGIGSPVSDVWFATKIENVRFQYREKKG